MSPCVFTRGFCLKKNANVGTSAAWLHLEKNQSGLTGQFLSAHSRKGPPPKSPDYPPKKPPGNNHSHFSHLGILGKLGKLPRGSIRGEWRAFLDPGGRLSLPAETPRFWANYGRTGSGVRNPLRDPKNKFRKTFRNMQNTLIFVEQKQKRHDTNRNERKKSIKGGGLYR